MAAAGGRQTLRSSSAVGMRVVSSRQRLVEDRQAGISDLRQTATVFMVGLASHNATPSFQGNPRVPCTLRRARRGFGWRAARLGGSHLSAQSARRSATGCRPLHLRADGQPQPAQAKARHASSRSCERRGSAATSDRRAGAPKVGRRQRVCLEPTTIRRPPGGFGRVQTGTGSTVSLAWWA